MKGKNPFYALSIPFIQRIMSHSPCDPFFHGFRIEAGKTYVIKAEKHAKLSMALLGNSDESRTKIKKPRSVDDQRCGRAPLREVWPENFGWRPEEPQDCRLLRESAQRTNHGEGVKGKMKKMRGIDFVRPKILSFFEFEIGKVPAAVAKTLTPLWASSC
jgi:hypothetical protein